MAQGDFLEDVDFGIDSSADIHEFDAYLNDDVIPSKTDPKLLPATDEDKKKVKENGKVKTDEDKRMENLVKEKDQKRKDEEDLLNAIENDDTEEEGTTVKDTDKPKSEQGSEEVPEITAIAEGLYKAGIFTKDDEDEVAPETTEEFIEKFNWEKQKGAEQMIHQFSSRYGEEYQELFNTVFVQGVPLKEYVTKWQDVQNFKDMDITDEDNQQKVVEAAYKNQGWEDADIKDKIKRLKLSSELEDEAGKHHKALIRIEEAGLIKMQESAKQQLAQEKLAEQQFSSNIRTILADKLKTQDFDGIPVTKESINKSIDFLENKKWKMKNGSLITDLDAVFMELKRPQNHAVAVKLSLLFNEFQPNKPLELNLKGVEKRAVSKETNELFNFNKTKKAKVAATLVPEKQKYEFLSDL